MKRLIAFLLTFVFVFALLPGISSSAATIPYIYMRPIMNSDKTNLTVEIYTNGLKWTAVDVGIKFDPSAMTLQSVTEGSKIATARSRGVDFVVGNREISQSNSAGYCNFVAVTGSTTCNMTSYAGPVAVYTFAVKNLAKAKTGYDLCVNTLTNASGQALISYTSFALSSPVVHTSNANNPFKYGDVSRDGKTTVSDAMLIMQYLVDITDLEEYERYLADVSGDRTVSISDAMLIMQYLVDIIKTFPAEG